MASDPHHATPAAAGSERHRGTDPGTRELRDPRDMRALAHPTRLALLEVLGVQGPLTATQAGVLVGESPSSCSFHLRTLARHNFVEEAGTGRGRQRPWQLVSLGNSIGTFDDPETELAAEALARMFFDRIQARIQAWWSCRHQETPAWAEGSGVNQGATWATAEEVRALRQDVRKLVDRYQGRMLDPSLRPEGSRPVESLFVIYPVEEWERPSGPEPDAASTE